MFQAIEKSAADWRVRPNLVDYDALCRAFDWPSARTALAGLPGGGLNIAHEAVDRHASRTGREGGAACVPATAPSRPSRTASWPAAARFANVLAVAGRRPRRPVFTLRPRSRLYTAVLGTLSGARVLPALLPFGPDPVGSG